jgi:hypothetical protein
MEVMKALVIGLGSSGIAVCNYVVERIRWELGDEKRAPWVRFLGIETNQTADTPLRSTGDLLLVTIDASEYSRLLKDDPAVEERFRLSQWADKEVLTQLPGNAVTEGAGNIRMVGRLVFFYHYQSISAEVSRRLNELRNLNPVKAREKRGALLSGEDPELEFIGDIRIFVVGTLCGGTCSGMVGDFGFLLRRCANPGEYIIGMFTLPPIALTRSIVPMADRYKKNAYTALIELNHYHLVDQSQQSSIIFPDRYVVDMRQTPYDLPYLFFPQGTAGVQIEEMHQRIADRIFFNIFAPRTDPFQRAIDAPILGDRRRHAHVFMSVGFSTMEYPVERIIEACTARQLEYTLGQWNKRTLSESEITVRLSEIGLKWETLCEWLFSLRGGGTIESVLQHRVHDIIQLAVHSPDKADEEIRSLREAFSNRGIIYDPPPQQIYPGVVVSTCLSNKENALHQFRDRVRAVIQRDLLDYQVGPAALRDLMQEAQNRLSEFRQVARPDINKSMQTVNQLLTTIKRTKMSGKLRWTGLQPRELRRLQAQLAHALNEEIKNRLKDAALTTLLGSSSEQGLLPQIEREAQILYRRLNNLVDRIMAQREIFDGRDDELSRVAPQAAGVILFKPDPDGTVTSEYQRCLSTTGDLGTTWRMQREKEAREIIRNWNELLQHVIPQGETRPDEDWLYQDFRRGIDRPFPDSLLNQIVNHARRPFLGLLRANIFEKWWEFYTSMEDRNTHAQLVCRSVSPSVRVDSLRAEQGGRSPIATWSVLVLPVEGQHREDFLNAIRSFLPANCGYAESPHKYRILMIQEWQRWPLAGVPEIVSPSNGLCTAECNDFPTFHTRKDVNWTPLTDQEIQQMERVENALMLGVLCDIVQPRYGKLEIQSTSMAPDDTSWQLPLELGQAIRQIIITRRDLNSRDLSNIVTVIEQRVRSKRHEIGDRQFVEFLITQLQSGKGNEIPGWDTNRVWKAIVQYCAADESLKQALMQVKPLSPEIKQSLWKRRGDPKPKGGTYDKDGYYCTKCGGLIGETEEEALRNGWRCYVNPDHCFYEMEELGRTT